MVICHDVVEVHPSTYIRIAQLQSSAALFPSLRQLDFYFNESFGSHIFLFLSPLLDSIELYNISGFEDAIVGPFLATLSKSPQMLRRIVLDSGRMPMDILKESFVHFKNLRSLKLLNAVFMADFSLWEVLGTLPSLENLNMEIDDPESYLVRAPENTNRQSGGLRYFNALESLHVTGPFSLIQHLLGSIDSPCLKSIKISPYQKNSERERDPGDLLTPSMTILASKWSLSLKEVKIGKDSIGITHRNSKFLMPLVDLHEIEKFDLVGWRMEKNNDALRCLTMSWPKLKYLGLVSCLSASSPNQISISLSNLRIIAENCPELRVLDIELDIDTIPPFDDISSKILCHELEVLVLRGVHQPIAQISLERQIQTARHLDLIFPYVNSINWDAQDRIWSGICDLVKLCQDARRGR